MKKLFSTRYSSFSFDLAAFLLRVVAGFQLFMYHGLSKLQEFESRKATFSDPLGVGHTTSLVLAILAEVVCAWLIIFGLLTRLASFILVVFFIVIIFVVHGDDPWRRKELALFFFFAFLFSLLCGPGKWSIDKLIGK